MATNQWVAIENEEAGQDDEPDQNWYYFQANGKALTNGSNDHVALKTINGKKYAFDDEGKMLWGWVNADSAEHIDNTDGDAFKEGDYYFGSADDGAMTVGWLQMDITYEEATSDYEIAPVFNDDEDQTRWFYFKSNGKKVKAEDGDYQKGRTINGRKYEFDEYGAMTAEWSLDKNEVGTSSLASEYSTASDNSVIAQYAQQWRYFNSVEDGSRVSKGWFKVVAAEWLNYDKYNDDEDAWYYADGSGNLYAGEFKTIKGKKYAFQDDGRMVSGLKFIDVAAEKAGSMDAKADDNETAPFDTEDDFLDSAIYWESRGYRCYYFGDGEDGAMKTGRTTIEIDGDSFTFNFETSGSKKGQGTTGVDDDKIYQSGMLLKAGSDEKYQVIEKVAGGYTKVEDAVTFYNKFNLTPVNPESVDLDSLGISRKAEDIDELYIIPQYDKDQYTLVNTSGKIIDRKSRNKDGNDFIYCVNASGVIKAIYTEQ